MDELREVTADELHAASGGSDVKLSSGSNLTVGMPSVSKPTAGGANFSQTAQR